MSNKRRIEIFSAGCPACDEAIQMVKRIACSSCETEVLDMSQPEIAARAKERDISRVPAIVIDGRLAECCLTGAIDGAVVTRCQRRPVIAIGIDQPDCYAE